MKVGKRGSPPPIKRPKPARNWFALSDRERERLDFFVNEHPYSCGRGRDDFTLRFTSTGIGTRVVVKCKGCGKKEDVSEYESW